MLGQKFDEALQLASDLHRAQTRKETPIPYIARLMAVAGIVLEANRAGWDEPLPATNDELRGKNPAMLEPSLRHPVQGDRLIHQQHF